MQPLPCGIRTGMHRMALRSLFRKFMSERCSNHNTLHAPCQYFARLKIIQEESGTFFRMALPTMQLASTHTGLTSW